MSGIEQATIASLGYETASNMKPCSPTIAFPPVTPGVVRCRDLIFIPPLTTAFSFTEAGVYHFSLPSGRLVDLYIRRSNGRASMRLRPKAHTHVLRLKT
jgi:hypothetical protein